MQNGRRKRYDRSKLEEFREMVVLMRYHSSKPTTNSRVFASYACIQKITGIPYSTVRNISLQAIQKKPRCTR